MIKDRTKGKVVGIDPSEGMIERAQKKFSKSGISFRVCSADQLDYQNEFDIIFCNSVFQWFVNPTDAIKTCYDSLGINGKMAIQAPAKNNYCSNFLRAINEVKNDKETQNIFDYFSSPWLFYSMAKEYSKLFEDVGFKVEKSIIDEVVTNHTAEEVYNIFESGAAAGYLNQSN